MLTIFDVPAGQNICKRNLNHDLTSLRDGIFFASFFLRHIKSPSDVTDRPGGPLGLAQL